MSRLEGLEPGPPEERPSSRRRRTGLAVIALAAVVLVGDGAFGRDPPPACWTVGATSSCRGPSARLALPAVTELVHGYCHSPGSAAAACRRRAAVVLVGLDTRPDELALRTDGPDGRAGGERPARPAGAPCLSGAQYRGSAGRPRAAGRLRGRRGRRPPARARPRAAGGDGGGGPGRKRSGPARRRSGNGTRIPSRHCLHGHGALQDRARRGAPARRRPLELRAAAVLRSRPDPLPHRLRGGRPTRLVRLRTPPRPISDPHDGLPTPSP